MVRTRFALILYFRMVAHKAACHTLSKAFLKSMKTWYRFCWCWRYFSHRPLYTTASLYYSLSILQKLVSEFVDYSKIERYLLQPSKSVILAITNQCRKRDEDGNINIVMNGERMPLVDETMHMGILCSDDSQLTAVEYTCKIDKARRTVYSLMSAGFHGENGLDPDTSVHLLQTYVLPVMVYGLDVLLPRRVLIEKIEKLF